MTTPPRAFKRLVLGCHPSAPGRTLHLAVDLAGLLHLDLLGLFLEDTSLRDLAALPFARECRTLGGWRPIDIERVSREAELSARAMERLFTEAAKSLLTPARFEVMRAPIADAIASVSGSGDIVVVIEPRSAAERATQQFTCLIEAALRSAAAVLLVPPEAASRRGPIVALVAHANDPSLPAAFAIARAAGEELIAVETGQDPDVAARVAEIAAEAGVKATRVAAGRSPWGDPALAFSNFHDLRERLIVLTRDAVPLHVATKIASARRAPVLIVEPD